MKFVVLAGGFGTRLGKETETKSNARAERELIQMSEEKEYLLCRLKGL